MADEAGRRWNRPCQHPWEHTSQVTAAHHHRPATPVRPPPRATTGAATHHPGAGPVEDCTASARAESPCSLCLHASASPYGIRAPSDSARTWLGVRNVLAAVMSDRGQRAHSWLGLIINLIQGKFTRQSAGRCPGLALSSEGRLAAATVAPCSPSNSLLGPGPWDPG